MDEKTHTDVIEKIVDVPKRTVYIDDYLEVTNNMKSIEDIENIEISKRKNIENRFIYDEESLEYNKNLENLKRTKVEKTQETDSKIVRFKNIDLFYWN